MIRFRALEGSLHGQEFTFEGPVVLLGRSPECDVLLSDSLCSRHHARLELKSGSCVLTDLQSTNGIRVNGKNVEAATLNGGDRFTVGENVFLFDGDGSAVAEKLTAADYADGTAVIERTQSFVDIENRLRQISETFLARDTNQKVSDEELAELQKANRQLHAMYRFSQAISSTLFVEDVYRLVSENVLRNFDEAETVSIFVREKEGGALECVETRARGDARESQVSRGVLARVEEDRVGILATDALEDDRFQEAQTIVRMNVRSFLCVPLATPKRFLGAVYAENCHKISCFTQADLELLTALGNQVAIALENALLYDELQRSFYETVRSLGNALEAKDKYTRGHSARVAKYAVGIARELGLETADVENVRIGAELHDIGKIAIREAIINTSSKLTDEEYEIIKQHPQLGVKILKPMRFLAPILPMVLHHHERYNGKGYPDGLVAEDIPLEARILNLADAFDAMTTQRPYNKPRTIDGALEHCLDEAGISFDSNCVNALVRYMHSTRREPAARAIPEQQSSENSEMVEDFVV